MELLAEAGADVLACETVPAAAEAEALLAEAEALGVPIWLSLTTVTGDDGVVRTRRGERAADVFAMAAGVDAVVAVGVNCTDPAGVGPGGRGGRAQREAGRRLPEQRRALGRRRRAAGPARPASTPTHVPRWVEAGARLVGGCCRVRPQHIAAIASVIRSPDQRGSSLSTRW